eukprot:sb/3463126/
MNTSTKIIGNDEVLPYQLRVCLSIYLIFTVIYCFLANAMITDYLRKARRVFRDLDSVSLTLLDHLALSDVLYQILRICPMAITSIAGRWLLGDTMCFLNSIVKYAPVTASLYFIFVLILVQIGRVGRSEEFIYTRSTGTLGRQISLALWLLSCLSSVLLVSYRIPYTYTPWSMGCENEMTTSLELGTLTTTYLIPISLLSLAVCILVFQCCLCCPNSFDARAILVVELAILYITTTAPSLTVRLLRFYRVLPECVGDEPYRRNGDRCAKTNYGNMLEQFLGNFLPPKGLGKPGSGADRPIKYIFPTHISFPDYLRKARRVFRDLDSVSLTLLDHLALSDVLYQLLRICPMAITSIAGRWLLGDTLCFLNSIVKYAPVTASLYFIFVLILVQIGRVGRSEEFIYTRSTGTLGRQISLALWLLSCLSSVLLVSYRIPYTYTPWSMGCENEMTTSLELGTLTTTYLIPIALLSLAVCILVFQCCLCCPNSFDARAILVVELAILYITTTAPSLTVRLLRFYRVLPAWSGVLESLTYTLFIIIRPMLFLSPDLKDHLVRAVWGRRGGAVGSVHGEYKVLSEPTLSKGSSWSLESSLGKLSFTRITQQVEDSGS